MCVRKSNVLVSDTRFNDCGMQGRGRKRQRLTRDDSDEADDDSDDADDDSDDDSDDAVMSFFSAFERFLKTHKKKAKTKKVSLHISSHQVSEYVGYDGCHT